LHAGGELARTVAEEFVQVGVHVVGEGAVKCDALAVFGTEDELLGEAVTLAAFGIGLRDVLYRDGFGTVVLPYPVRIGEVDAYRRGGVTVASEDGRVDDLRRYAFHLFLLVFVLNGRMVFEPLRIGGDGFGASRGV